MRFEKKTGETVRHYETKPETVGDETEIFADKHALLTWLQENGFKISRATLYRAVKAGLLMQGPGGFRLADVRQYAETHLPRECETPVADAGGADEAQGVAAAKAAAEARKAAAQATHWETKTEQLLGNLVDRNEFERQIAARSALFRSDLENMAYGVMPELCNVLGGDPLKIPDGQQALLQEINKTLGRYAVNATFRVAEDR